MNFGDARSERTEKRSSQSSGKYIYMIRTCHEGTTLYTEGKQGVSSPMSTLD